MRTYMVANSFSSTMEGDSAAADCALVDSSLFHEDASMGYPVESKPRFQCPDCSKSYATRKSLQV